MANLVSTEANALLAASSGQAGYVAPIAPVKVALLVTMGSATAAGVEVSGGSYIRINVTFAAPAGGSIASAMPRHCGPVDARLHRRWRRGVGLCPYSSAPLVWHSVGIKDGQCGRYVFDFVRLIPENPFVSDPAPPTEPVEFPSLAEQIASVIRADPSLLGATGYVDEVFPLRLQGSTQ